MDSFIVEMAQVKVLTDFAPWIGHREEGRSMGRVRNTETRGRGYGTTRAS